MNRINFVKICVCVSIVSGTIGGCAKSTITPVISKPDKFRLYDKIYDIPQEKYIWEAELDKFIECNLFIGSKLELIDYKFVRFVNGIEDLKKIKSTFFDDDALLPNRVEDNFYKIERVGELKKDWYKEKDLSYMNEERKIEWLNWAKEYDIIENGFKRILNMNVPTSKEEIVDFSYIFEQGDLKILTLEWNYCGDVLHTVCLVSDTKGLVYDNIMCNLSLDLSDIKTKQELEAQH